ncbi:MAG: UDP-N-acetylglucosamine 1-carboxyvinyltransferase [Chloroflexota bacterium]
MADARPFHWEYTPEPVAREVFVVEGGRPLHGTVRISGSKNAALKMLAAATLTGERCRFTNVPEIEDVRAMAETLRELGVVVDHPEPNVYEIASGDIDWLFVPLEAAAKMRASFMLLGPLLARFGRVIISNPGGDRIGRRPVNLHVEAMRSLGAVINYKYGYYYATAPGRLRGGEIRFPFVTVMGTENAMLAATLAEGHTIIRPAAREPEVDDLIAFLQKMGADVARTYPDTIEVHGRKRLRGAEHNVVPDRIEAGTFIVAAAITGGRVTLEGAPSQHLGAFLELMASAGLAVSCDADRIEVDGRVPGPGHFRPCDVMTAPYPGLATDLQPPTSVFLTQCAGTSRVDERIFEDRLEFLVELRKMGARVDFVGDHTAVIDGPSPLHGAEVEIGDLRAGASLILGALAADGVSKIHGAHHVHRGYENIDRKFQELDARIVRTADRSAAAGVSAPTVDA